jgi:hypothetical protein
MNDMRFSAVMHKRAASAASRIVAIALLPCAVGSPLRAADALHWIATWAARAMPAGTGTRKVAALESFTLRQAVSSSIGGESLRLRISNVFGDKPLVLAGATVAVRGENTKPVLALRYE